MPPIWLLALLARTGIAQRFQKAAAWIVAVLFFALVLGLLTAAFWGWVHAREDTAVKLDRQDVTIEAANRVINATTAADANEQAAQDVFANDQKELQHEVDTKGTGDSAGPAVSGVLSRLREQQAAGRRGQGAAR